MKKIVFPTIMAILFLTGISFAAEKKAADAKVAVKEPETKAQDDLSKKELTKEDYAERLKKLFDNEPAIMNFIPGIKKQSGKDGKASYLYNGVNINDLDKEEIKKLYPRAQTQATRIRTERLNKQLEAVSRANQAARTANQAQGAPRVVTPPPQPPRVPQQPPSSAQIPRQPPTPPQPPRR